MPAGFSPVRKPLTRAQYERQFAEFQQWCANSDAGPPLPTSRETVLAYVQHLVRMGRLGRCAIRTRLAAINAAHRDKKKTAPIDARLRRDLVRVLRRRPEGDRQKYGLTDSDLCRLLATCGREKANDIRDRAIILCSRHAALTRGEVVALSMADLEWTGRGCVLRIDPPRELMRQKTSLVCPVRALERWLAVDGHRTGLVFHSANAGGVSRMIMRRLESAKLDRMKYSHVSLRFGRWVDLACAGTETREIARAYGVSVSEVAKILERHGAGAPRRKRSR